MPSVKAMLRGAGMFLLGAVLGAMMGLQGSEGYPWLPLVGALVIGSAFALFGLRGTEGHDERRRP